MEKLAGDAKHENWMLFTHPTTDSGAAGYDPPILKICSCVASVVRQDNARYTGQNFLDIKVRYMSCSLHDMVVTWGHHCMWK